MLARLRGAACRRRRAALAMSYRRLLRDLSRWRLPPGDEERVRVLLKQVVRAPAGDDVLPAALCASLCKTYSTLQRPGRLGVISILAAFGARDEIVQGAAERLVLSKGRDTAPRLQAHLSLREALVPRHELVANRIVQQAGGLPFLVSLRADLLAALSGQLELGEVDGMGGNGGGGGGGSGVGSSDRTGEGTGEGTVLSRDAARESTGGGAGATAGHGARLEVEQAEIEGDRAEIEGDRAKIDGDGAEIVARSELAAATRARWRLLDDSLRRVLAPWCAPLLLQPCCCTPAAAPRAHTARLLLHLTPCISPRAPLTPCTSPGARRFGSGLLELQELCWESTPAPLLERVVAYERVHAMPGARA